MSQNPEHLQVKNTFLNVEDTDEMTLLKKATSRRLFSAPDLFANPNVELGLQAFLERTNEGAHWDGVAMVDGVSMLQESSDETDETQHLPPTPDNLRFCGRSRSSLVGNRLLAKLEEGDEAHASETAFPESVMFVSPPQVSNSSRRRSLRELICPFNDPHLAAEAQPPVSVNYPLETKMEEEAQNFDRVTFIPPRPNLGYLPYLAEAGTPPLTNASTSASDASPEQVQLPLLLPKHVQAQKPKKRIPGPPWCHIHISPEMTKGGFDTNRRIIGTRGVHTRAIYEATGAKIRLRGMGSGHFERNGKEAPAPLMLAITGTSTKPDAFHEAMRQCLHLLVETQIDFQHSTQPFRRNQTLAQHLFYIGNISPVGKDIAAPLLAEFRLDCPKPSIQPESFRV